MSSRVDTIVRACVTAGPAFVEWMLDHLPVECEDVDPTTLDGARVVDSITRPGLVVAWADGWIAARTAIGKSAAMNISARRTRGTTRLELHTADGQLTIAWPWKVDDHEVSKACACGSPKRPWREVLEAVSSIVDCQGADVEHP